MECDPQVLFHGNVAIPPQLQQQAECSITPEVELNELFLYSYPFASASQLRAKRSDGPWAAEAAAPSSPLTPAGCKKCRVDVQCSFPFSFSTQDGSKSCEAASSSGTTGITCVSPQEAQPGVPYACDTAVHTPEIPNEASERGKSRENEQNLQTEIYAAANQQLFLSHQERLYRRRCRASAGSSRQFAVAMLLCRLRLVHTEGVALAEAGGVCTPETGASLRGPLGSLQKTQHNIMLQQHEQANSSVRRAQTAETEAVGYGGLPSPASLQKCECRTKVGEEATEPFQPGCTDSQGKEGWHQSCYLQSNAFLKQLQFS